MSRLDQAAAAWTVLSTAYGRLPQAGFVDTLRSPEELTHWPYQDRTSRAGIVLLTRSAESLDEVVTDHRRLFIGPRPLPAPPWESVHRGREGLVFGTQTLAVRAFYRRFGLQSPELNRAPDDHVALEASFLATLCVRALDALEDGADAAAAGLVAGLGEFVDEHLSRWLPAFLAKVDAHARTDYHRGLARLTEGALSHARQLATSTASRP